MLPGRCHSVALSVVASALNALRDTAATASEDEILEKSRRYPALSRGVKSVYA